MSSENLVMKSSFAIRALFVWIQGEVPRSMAHELHQKSFCDSFFELGLWLDLFKCVDQISSFFSNKLKGCIAINFGGLFLLDHGRPISMVEIVLRVSDPSAERRITEMAAGFGFK